MDSDEDEFVFVTLEECSSRAGNVKSNGDDGDWFDLVPTPCTTSRSLLPPPPSSPPSQLSHFREVNTQVLQSDNCGNERDHACEFPDALQDTQGEEEEGEDNNFEALCKEFEKHCQTQSSNDPLALDSTALHNKMDIYIMSKRCGTNAKMDLLGNRARRRQARNKYWRCIPRRNALDTYL